MAPRTIFYGCLALFAVTFTGAFFAPIATLVIAGIVAALATALNASLEVTAEYMQRRIDSRRILPTTNDAKSPVLANADVLAALGLEVSTVNFRKAARRQSKNN